MLCIFEAMADFVEEPFTVISPRYQHKLSCIFHRKRFPFIDDQSREHVVILCHGYLSNKNALFLPQLSRDISDSSIDNNYKTMGSAENQPDQRFCQY